MEGSKSESMSGGCRDKTDKDAQKGQQTEATSANYLHWSPTEQSCERPNVSPTVYLGQSYIIH